MVRGVVALAEQRIGRKLADERNAQGNQYGEKAEALPDQDHDGSSETIGGFENGAVANHARQSQRGTQACFFRASASLALSPAIQSSRSKRPFGEASAAGSYLTATW